MRSQEDRDTVTLGIFTAVLIFALTLAVGALLLILVDRLLGEGTVSGALGCLVLACASVVSVSYLWRHRRP